ncbi:2Fe-2S iron-sulfur cluster-binding protein [Brumicola pallidula]|jgi:2Fe-2S ferredoxin|uniref:Rhodocoxin n=1 Tax=Brumicola pallidula DSM 14239 = ACAM 615 TaxID=1121922 RepID=K6ZFC6_9ALTE|nr:2Fe-2S iron-sulfur cluster-binding protein [Glaciecola pallidula]GAC29057.1 rhodocoxin [Glaciecola pallidula DSM 14239 = ACAM 615]
MGIITFIDINGQSKETIPTNEVNLMQLAVNNNILGIDAECGGCCSCATCHVVINNKLDIIPKAQGDELELLNFVPNKEDNSRLSCQVLIDETLNDLIVEVKSA